jgi:hypothetical protein
MSGEYSVRRSTPLAEEGELLRLWRENLPLGCDASEKFRWTYRDAPLPVEDVFLLAVKQDGGLSAVGTCGLGARLFKVGQEETLGVVLGDFAVDAGHRTLMPATVLMRAARREVLGKYKLAYGFPNDRAVPVCRRVGYAELGKMTRYVRVLRYERFLRRAVDLPIATKMAAHAIDAATHALSAPAHFRARRSFHLEWMDRTDARFDVLWKDARSEYPIMGERGAAFLGWRLLGNPALTCTIAALASKTDGRLEAYAAVSLDGAVARVLDLFGRKRALGPLLDSILPALRARGASTVEFRYLGSPHVCGVLRSRGFVAREATRVVVFDFAPELSAHAALLKDAASWHLTDADEDT